MKRTLSLILALAMIMSLFTTVSFAATVQTDPDVTAETSKWPYSYDEEADKLTVYYLGTLKADEITVKIGGSSAAPADKNVIKGDKLEYYDNSKGYYQLTINPIKVDLTLVKLGSSSAWTHKDNDYYYTGTADENNFYVYPSVSGVTLTQSITSNSLKVTGMTVSGVETAAASFSPYDTTYKVTSDTYYVSTPTKFSIPGKLDVKKTFKDAFGTDLTGTIDTFTVSVGGTPLGADKLTYYTSGDNIGTVLCKDARVFAENIDNAKATVTANGKTLIMPLKLDRTGSDVTIEIVNGSWVDYTGKDDTGILAAIEKKIGGAVTAVTLKAGAASDSIYYYGDKKADADNADVLAVNGTWTLSADSDEFSVKTTAGTIGDRTMTYETTVGGNTYAGTITFESVYATKKTDKQAPLFFYEWTYLDSISGIKWLDETDAEYVFSSGAIEKYYETLKVDPNGKTSDWTWTYTGYDSNKVAKQVDITFTPVDYDILAYVEADKSPFSFEAFELFAESVAEAQDVYYDVAVDHVEFDEVSGSKWTLKKGSKKISTADEFTSSTIGSVYLDVTVAGYYDIPFSVYYDSKDSKNDSWTKNATKHYQGLIRVYAGEDGDIKYEVSSGDTVNFKSADFAALYKKMAGSKKTLETVTVDVLPVYGALYRNSKVSTSYAVKAGDTFYYDPSSANSSYDLAKVTYWASKSSSAEYSVYIPVTMNGTGGEEVAVVEIVVNTGIPFTDIAKGSTFYDYIEYCYNNGIMGGKSSTNFDAKSSITRAQLVTTLYRMAGSPATYNNKTLPFTDTTALSKEFSNAVKWAYYNKIVGGTSATTFAPNTAVTRQALVKILYGYATAYDLDYGMVIGSNLGYYTDGGTVSASMKDAMNWALDYGLLSGNGNKLNPRGSTTRGAAAKILANFHANFVV